MDPERRPARAQAWKRINELLDSGNVKRTVHWKRRASERGFDIQDALLVAENGRIEDEGEWDAEHGNWKFSIVGHDSEGREFKMIVAFSRTGNDLFLISGMRKERGKWAGE